MSGKEFKIGMSTEYHKRNPRITTVNLILTLTSVLAGAFGSGRSTFASQLTEAKNAKKKIRAPSLESRGPCLVSFPITL